MSDACQRFPIRALMTSILAATFIAAGTRAIYQLLNGHLSNVAGTDHRAMIAIAALSSLVSGAGIALAGPHSLDLIKPGLVLLAGASRLKRFIFACVALLALLLVARFVLNAFPNSGDEYAYLLQAQTYARGRLWVDPPPLADAFALGRFQIKNGMWLAQYEPGWALILAPAVWLGIPAWTVNPILGVGLLFAFWALAREQMGKEAAAAGVIAIAGSAFFILNAASFFSHVACALWGVLFALFAVRYLQTGKYIFALLAGAFVGLLGLTRTFNAIIFIVPFIVTLGMSPRRRVGFLPFMLGGLPFAVALLAFDQAITGNPFTPVQSWINQGEPLGAPSAHALYIRLTEFARLSAFTSPLLVLGFIPAFIWLLRRRKLAFTDWIAPLTVTGFAFYAAGAGDQYGPRYFFEAFPFAVLTIAKAIDGSLFAKGGERRVPLLASALLLHFAVQAGYLGPALAREHLVIFEREDIYRKVADAHLTKAVVLVTASGTGKIRWMPPQDLVRNGLRIDDQPVLYAHDLGAQNKLIKALFPERTLYLYADGKLTPLSDDGGR
jgi:hypothetical protein